MNSNVLVHCQYYENYNVGPEGFGEVPYWKPKGGHTFKMPIDSDIMLYADTDVILKAIKDLVESQNSIAERFEYIEHELEISEPTLVEGLESQIIRVNSLVSEV